jgi:hypothetical protein
VSTSIFINEDSDPSVIFLTASRGSIYFNARDSSSKHNRQFGTERLTKAKLAELKVFFDRIDLDEYKDNGQLKCYNDDGTYIEVDPAEKDADKTAITITNGTNHDAWLLLVKERFMLVPGEQRVLPVGCWVIEESELK